MNCKTLLIAAATQGSFMVEDRPDAVGFTDDPETGVRCHYQRAQLATRCDLVFEAIADSWEAQTALGWPDPIPDDEIGGTDGLDVYLHDDAGGGAYVDSPYTDADPDDGRRGAWSHMVIDPSIDPDEYDEYVAHEFNHVLQFALDIDEPSLPPWEGAATRAEEVTYPGHGSGPEVAPDYNATPWVSMLQDGWWLWREYEIWSYYEYGSVLFFDDLREEHGVTAADFWWAMSEEKAGNDIDAIDAYEAVTGDAKQAWMDFGVRRARMGTDAAPDWAKDMYPDAAMQLNGYVDTSSTIDWEYGVADWGIGAFGVDEPGVLVITGDESVEWAIVNATTGEEITADLTVATGDVILAFNFGPANFTAESTPRLRELTVGLSPLPEDTGDTGDPITEPDPDEPKACGCASGTPVPGALLVLAGLMLLRRRS
ncbi:MAG: hypothetical protein GY913_07280 [Proteobacteria bacterium]|nr:hypothetical protein [Pseudomonadota bacterium]MCP4916711.1 hypothetical protein [Pseudomonadota bacterium]